MLSLIDGDIITYRIGFASENDDEDIACVRANTMVEEIIRDVQAQSFKVYLSDSLEKNYRYAVSPDYKANRLNQPKPKHYAAIKLFLQQEWDAEITKGQEADDAMGIAQTFFREELQQGWSVNALIKQEGKTPIEANGEPCCICSIDKDMLMIPGLHYNFVKKEFTEVNDLDGLKHFYKQMLIGDRTDNIFGVDGIGKVKSGRWIDKCEDELDMFNTVYNLYDDPIRMRVNGQLLWIRRKENEDWSKRFDELEIEILE